MNHHANLSKVTGFVHKLAVLCKDYYVIRTTDDLFMFAGADISMYRKVSESEANSHSMTRTKNFYHWIEGIKEKAPDELDKIIGGVAIQIIENEAIPEGDRHFLSGHMERSGAADQLAAPYEEVSVPAQVEKLLEILITGLSRAMYPLKHRRSEASFFAFDNEYDVHSVLHAVLRPWIRDVRPEEYTPSYAGTSARVDFLLPEHKIVMEVKYIRDKSHGKTVGGELILDIAHYKVHPQCRQLWMVIYDPHRYIQNPSGLSLDLATQAENMVVKTFVLGS